ncbi:Unknown protein [Striga hermonthica]|uniref:Uncharacterized protein n=1 Tax=Striga hermonthica TaxID=68872 RepID=A0A9N7RMQ9_STRHE|nr:Unknown protein [Striga hermonthica]
MEVSVPGNTSLSLDSSCGSLTADPHNLIQNDSEDLSSMSDLKTCLTELLNIDENGISTSGSHLSFDKNCTGNAVRDCDCKDLGQNVCGGRANGKCLSKCATFPPVHEPKSSGDVIVGEKGKHVQDTTIEVSEGNGSAKPANPCYARSTSLPVPLKLISAMKGSREKHNGTSPKKLSVVWAPDVYDPIPTSVSHVPTDRNQRHRNNGRKSGKYKQKNSGKSSSRGGKSKDKKQVRKSSAGPSSSNGKLKQPFPMGGGIVLGRSLDYNVVGGPDPLCGSSFLKESVTVLHFPVAEAT